MAETQAAFGGGMKEGKRERWNIRVRKEERRKNKVVILEKVITNIN